MTSTMPRWEIPQDLDGILDRDGEWEDLRWEPIALTVMGGTVFHGREIALCWQIEFSPGDEFFDEPCQVLERAGIEADGYGWLNLIEKHLAKTNPALLEKLETGDTEGAACVIWVEDENDCRALIEAVWTILHNPKGPLT
jgi:hypothetical protein